MSEWLRRWTRNPLGSARRGSNPLGVGNVVCLRLACCMLEDHWTIAIDVTACTIAITIVSNMYITFIYIWCACSKRIAASHTWFAIIVSMHIGQVCNDVFGRKIIAVVCFDFWNVAFDLNSKFDAEDTVSEWLRRWTRNPLGSARRGSNPLAVDHRANCYTRPLLKCWFAMLSCYANMPCYYAMFWGSWRNYRTIAHARP